MRLVLLVLLLTLLVLVLTSILAPALTSALALVWEFVLVHFWVARLLTQMRKTKIVDVELLVENVASKLQIRGFQSEVLDQDTKN